MTAADAPPATTPTASSRLLLLIAAALVAGLLTAGLFKIAVEAVLPHSETLQELLRYSPAQALPGSDSEIAASTWDLARGWRRYLMLVAGVLFLVFRRWVPWAALVRRGFRTAEQPRRDLASGTLLALGLVAGYWIVLVVAGYAAWAPRSPGYLASKIPQFVVSALLVALAEEVFFRGVMLRAMLRDWGMCRALTASSLVYALLHCLNGTMEVGFGWQPAVGSRLLRAYLVDANGSILPDLRLVVGLFLLGWLFAWLYLRTGSLWTSIGLHGGLVLFTKLAKKLMARAEGYPEWAFGDTVFMVSGVVAWVALVLTLIAVPWVTRAGPLARRMARRRTG